jgi:N-glycosidase YbiA
MAAAPSDSDHRAARPWLRRSWDGPDVVRFYAGSPFSNFARSPIWLPCPLDSDVLVEHPTVEHAFQAAKATTWPDFRRVWLAPTPAEAKRIGRWEITARPDWPSHRFHAMLAALRAKYRIPRFREALLATGDRPLAEDSPSDFEWGARDGRGGYTGCNYLGRALMRVRDELRQRPPEPPDDPSHGGEILRHTRPAPRHAEPPAGDLARIEGEVLERCTHGGIPWRPAGRDARGRLVLVADVGAGSRRPGQRRRATLTVDPAGLIYRDDAPPLATDQCAGRAGDELAGRRPEPPDRAAQRAAKSAPRPASRARG